MTGIAIIRPGLYAVVVQVGGVTLEGTSVNVIPYIAGDVDPGGACALMIDVLLMSAGVLPDGLMIGVPQ